MVLVYRLITRDRCRYYYDSQMILFLLAPIYLVPYLFYGRRSGIISEGSTYKEGVYKNGY